tara:strand:- start:56 stop:577 length:522 start_codon:yes stop_codon:yes gene_type:complete
LIARNRKAKLGKMKRITEDQLRLAKRMREKGESWPAIASATGASERGIRYQASKRGWIKGQKTAEKRPLPDLPADTSKAGKKLAKAEALTIDQIAERVKDQLANDIEASARALASWQADSLELRDWEKRERIAESIQKRAVNLLEVGEKDQNVVNIAVLSQLPEGASSSVIEG